MRMKSLTGVPLACGFATTDKGYFETRGVNVLNFSNCYDGLFSDAKMSGVELVHYGVRTATNGDVRMSPTLANDRWVILPPAMTRQD